MTGRCDFLVDPSFGCVDGRLRRQLGVGRDEPRGKRGRAREGSRVPPERDHRDAGRPGPTTSAPSTSDVGKKTLTEHLPAVPGPRNARPAGEIPLGEPSSSSTAPLRSPRAIHDLFGPTNAGSAALVGQLDEEADDQRVFDSQTRLKNTDVEIPALEGALLATRKRALQEGLISQASFDAALLLSAAMAKLRPAIAANAPADVVAQQQAASHAQLLYAALQRETADENNYDMVPAPRPSTTVTSQNRYTGESRVTTMGGTQHFGSPLENLPGLIRAAQWEEALSRYHELMEGLDRWIADRLRRKGPSAKNAGDAHEYFSQLRTGLEQIADKHASRLPAVFHPDADTLAEEKAAGRAAADAIPVNLYVWKDDETGRYHLRDLTTPSRPHEQELDGPPTAARLATFFEEVARYPLGRVRVNLPSGEIATAATTGKTKWYEWVAYAGLALAGVGLALVTAGASIPATVCFAAGAIAGGVSAGGHLVDSVRLGTATTASIVVDASQIAASFSSAGALSITVKGGGAAVALAQSRWFVPLATAAASADVVQLVALTDSTLAELAHIQHGPGKDNDKQRAMSILLAQLMVAGGLTALSVQGARSARALVGRQLEVVNSNGTSILRIADEMPASATEVKVQSPSTHEPAPATPPSSLGVEVEPADPKAWMTKLRELLSPEEQAKLSKMVKGKADAEQRAMFSGNLVSSRERVRDALRMERRAAAAQAQSKSRAAQLRQTITSQVIPNDPDIAAIISDASQDLKDKLPILRDKLVARMVKDEMLARHPHNTVLDGVKIYEKLPETTVSEWLSKNPGKSRDGLTMRSGELYMQRGEIDIMVIQPDSGGGKAKILLREEIKTGALDTHAKANSQLKSQGKLIEEAAAGTKKIRLEVGGRDIVDEVDLTSDRPEFAKTRGPAGKNFDESLGLTASDLEGLCKDLLNVSPGTETRR